MTKADTLPSKARKTAIVVLGVDDEADRTLLRLLGTLGCTLPADVRKKTATPPLDGFEPAAVRNLNTRLVEGAGGGADDASPFHPEWRQSPGAKAFVRHAVTALEEQFGNAPLIALGGRDLPRLFPLWAEALRLFGCNIRPIVMLRNPLEVGQAALDAEASSPSLAEAIWLRRALDAEHFTRGELRYFTSFERLCQSWDVVVHDAQEALQLAWPKTPGSVELEVEELLSGLKCSKELQARAMTNTLLPPWIRESYKILNGWAASEEMAAHHALLDTLRGDFDVAADAFGRLVRAERHAQLKIAEQQRARLQAEIDGLTRSVSASEAGRAALAGERDQWKSAQEKHRAERDDLVRQRDALIAERGRLIEERDSRRTEREALIAKRDGVMAERDRLIVQRDADRAKYDALFNERTALIAERDALFNERTALIAERDALLLERKDLRADRDALLAERNLLIARVEDLGAQLAQQRAGNEEQANGLKASLQEQRRTTTLLRAEVQEVRDRCDEVESELADARAEIAATRARRKEMARVIANRDAQLSARYQELARLQQQMLRSDPLWRIKRSLARLKRRVGSATAAERPARG